MKSGLVVQDANYSGKSLLALICAACFLAATALASSPVTLTISNASSYSIPDNFSGLSFETSTVVPNPNKIPRGKPFYLFSPTNQDLIAIFQNLGIKNLRVGGGTVDTPRRHAPEPADVDQLFAFAKNADVRVIFSFRLLNGDPSKAANAAKYIWQHYRQQLDCFAIGNEPDWRAYHHKDPKITNYPTYLADWRNFAAAIRAAVPDATFAGPDTGSDYPVQRAANTDYQGKSWTQRFADDEKNSGMVAIILQHDYVGQLAKGFTARSAIKAMLSPTWDDTKYPALYDRVLEPVAADGFPFRMTECNDRIGGVKGASNGYASALWALDYMHWWAAHGCAGVNFHNNEWLLTDTVYLDASGNYHLNPKAYGIKAFDLGGHGDVAPVGISNPDHINLTAYAVRNATNILVTVINKERGLFARKVELTITPGSSWKSAQVLFLTGNLSSKTGITLGGAAMGNDGSWNGQWTTLKPDKSGQYDLKVPAASAAIVKFSAD